MNVLLKRGIFMKNGTCSHGTTFCQEGRLSRISTPSPSSRVYATWLGLVAGLRSVRGTFPLPAPKNLISYPILSSLPSMSALGLDTIPKSCCIRRLQVNLFKYRLK